MTKPSALRSASRKGHCCKLCLEQGRIAWYTSLTWHRFWHRHWPQGAEAYTADEVLLRGVEGKIFIKELNDTAAWIYRTERLMRWIWRSEEKS